MCPSLEGSVSVPVSRVLVVWGIMLQGAGCGTSLVCLLDASLSLGYRGARGGWMGGTIHHCPNARSWFC